MGSRELLVVWKVNINVWIDMGRRVSEDCVVCVCNRFVNLSNFVVADASAESIALWAVRNRHKSMSGEMWFQRTWHAVLL